MEEEKLKKKNKVLTVIVILLLIVIIGYICYIFYINKIESKQSLSKLNSNDGSEEYENESTNQSKELGVEDAKKIASDYWELKDNFYGSSVLYILAQKNLITIDSTKRDTTFNDEGYFRTGVKFSDYKNAMMNYVSEDDFNKEWYDSGFEEGKDGIIIVGQGGGGDEYTHKVNDAVKINDLTYEIKVTTISNYDNSSKDENYEFVFVSQNGKYVVDSCTQETSTNNNSNTNVSNTNSIESSANKSQALTSEDVKGIALNYLELKNAMTLYSVLDELKGKNMINYDIIYDSTKNDGYGNKTNLKWTDYKNAMLNYISESNFNSNEWSNNERIYEGSDGYTNVEFGGGAGYVYKVEDATKISDLTYDVKVTATFEGDNSSKVENYKFVFVYQNGKYVVDSCTQE